MTMEKNEKPKQQSLDEEQRIEEEHSTKENKSENTIFGFDYYLVSTVSLAVISLCALIVSIYQTNVLSGQQEVMNEQQVIMRSQQELMQTNAKAQLWPRLRVGFDQSYEGTELKNLEFIIFNEGTGPALVEYIAIGYNGAYATSWYNLWNAANIPDFIPRTITNQLINNRVIQAGERYTFLSLSENPALMEVVLSDIKSGQGLEMILCYQSVFDEHWLIEGDVYELVFRVPVQVDSCITKGKPLFLN